MDDIPKRIVLATDGSDDARLAARAAVDLAGREEAELHLVHAWNYVSLHAGYPDAGWRDCSRHHEREARRVLEGQVDLIEALGGTVTETRLPRRSPIDAILDLCQEIIPGLLVVGSRGLSPLRRAVLGGVSEGVVHHARQPVLVVRGGDDAWPMRRLVVGHDGSEDADRAAVIAAGMSRSLDADYELVRGHENPPEPIGGWSTEDLNKLETARIRAHDDLKNRAEKLGKILDAPLGARIIEGDPTLALLKAAEEGNESRTMLVVGGRGLGATSRIRLGSVSNKVLRTACGPILVCPQDGVR